MSATNGNPKSVLFVDDERAFLEVIQLQMERISRGEWEVHTAESPREALAALEKRAFDLVVLDLRMPVVDGAQFLGLLQRKYPQLKRAVLSGFIDEACRASSLSGGAELVLEKPRTPEGFEIVFAALNELLRWEPEQGFQGVLRRVGLEDVLQMECLSRHSLILQITARRTRGRIYIHEGALVHAEFGEMQGERALQELVTLGGGEFQHLPFEEPLARTLEGPWEFLLMEAVRKRDEAAHGIVSEEPASEVQEAKPPPSLAQESPTLPPGPHSPEIREIVAASESGELLYQFRAENADSRCALVKAVHDFASRMQSLMAVGSLERVEFLHPTERALVRVQDKNSIFIRAAT
jgi:CheY-like chemotaxis protein